MLITGAQARLNTARRDIASPSPVPPARRTGIRFPKGRVRTMAGYRAGNRIALDRVVATFGRRGNELAVITRRPHGYFITHVEGRRYPRVNGQSIGKDAHALRHGDMIEVADEKLEFLLQ